METVVPLKKAPKTTGVTGICWGRFRRAIAIVPGTQCTFQKGRHGPKAPNPQSGVKQHQRELYNWTKVQ